MDDRNTEYREVGVSTLGGFLFPVEDVQRRRLSRTEGNLRKGQHDMYTGHHTSVRLTGRHFRLTFDRRLISEQSRFLRSGGHKNHNCVEKEILHFHVGHKE